MVEQRIAAVESSRALARTDALNKLFKAPAGRGWAYRRVFSLILTRRLEGPIVENRLARDLGLPRSVLRETLDRLAAEEILAIGDNSRYVTRWVGLREYMESADIRCMMESEAAELAVGKVPREQVVAIRERLRLYWSGLSSEEALWRLDDSVHDLMLDHCGNPILADSVRSLRTTIRLFDVANFERRRPPERQAASQAEHLEILDALEKGDRRRLGRVVRAHILSANHIR